MSEPQFPIYCKDEYGIFVHMIVNENQVLTLTNSFVETSISLTEYAGQTHRIYKAWKEGKLQESNAKDFNFQRILTNNPLISIGVSKKAQIKKGDAKDYFAGPEVAEGMSKGIGSKAIKSES